MKKLLSLILSLTAALSLTAQKAERKMFDFIVPDDGGFKEAIKAANERKDTLKRFYILVRQGDYRIPASVHGDSITGMDGKKYPDPRTDLTASRVSIIGEGMETTTVRNTCPTVTIEGKWGPACPIEGLRKAYTLKNSGNDNYFQDITLVNGMADHTGRGEAYEESGDRTIMVRVGLWGYQDTYCSNRRGGRYYMERCIIRGRTDYLCGKGDVFFNQTEFRQCDKGGYILAPSTPTKYGYVMRDCAITGESGNIDGTFTLGRPWGKGEPTAYWINTTCLVKPADKGWDEMSGGWPARFAEHGSKDANGKPLDLAKRKRIWQYKDGEAHENNPLMTDEEAERLTPEKVLAGSDGWNPVELIKTYTRPTLRRNPLKETKEAFFKTEEARKIGDQILLYQRVTGGWPKNINMAIPLNEAARQVVLAEKNNRFDSTTDNEATNPQITYLARLYKATGDNKYREAFNRGIQYLLSGQYANGGWPQFWPENRGYQVHITFNDNAMVNTMRLIRDVAEAKAPYDGDIADQALRKTLAKAFDKGIECILNTQIIYKGKPTVWCQQHDHETLKPAPARAYELPSFCSQESREIVKLLMSLPKPNKKVKRAIHGAMEWFNKYKIMGMRLVRTGGKTDPDRNAELVPDPTATATWARFYDLENCEPFVCDRDGIPRRHLSEIGQERRTGYSWYDDRPAEIFPIYDKWADQYDPKNKVKASLTE